MFTFSQSLNSWKGGISEMGKVVSSHSTKVSVRRKVM